MLKKNSKASDQVATGGDLKQGDRVVTPSGRVGEILVPQGNDVMPKHCLVRFQDDSDRRWLLAQILQKE